MQSSPSSIDEVLVSVQNYLRPEARALCAGLKGAVNPRGAGTGRGSGGGLDAEDLLQEAACAILAAWHKRRSEEAALGFALTVGRNAMATVCRRLRAAKRGGELQRESESLTRLALPESKESPVDFEALDAAVTKLAALDKFKASIVELRYFAGLTGDQTALALGTSPSTIAREWAFIRVWLHRELSAAKPT